MKMIVLKSLLQSHQCSASQKSLLFQPRAAEPVGDAGRVRLYTVICQVTALLCFHIRAYESAASFSWSIPAGEIQLKSFCWSIHSLTFSAARCLHLSPSVFIQSSFHSSCSFLSTSYGIMSVRIRCAHALQFLMASHSQYLQM